MSCNKSFGSGKQVVSVNTTEEVKEVPAGNGMVSKITTIVTKTTYSDGSTSTSTQTRTVTESSSTCSNATRSITTSSSGNLTKERRDSSSESDDEKDSSKNSNEGFTEFQIQSLKAHNEYRKKHGAPPMKLSQKLCQFSQSWADNLTRMNRMQHSQGSGYGENIYWSSGNSSNGKDAVDSWYSEIKDYNFRNQGFSSGTGHFTQVVWKDSTELGVGRSASGRGTYVVSNYNPPGNFQGRFQSNVSPPK